MYHLDFNIDNAVDRCKYIQSQNLSNLSKKELEACANYILWGKDDDGKSVVDKKYVFIKTKYQSWNRNNALSLEELLENPNFDEGCFTNVAYKFAKEELGDCSGVQDLVELQNDIQKVEDILKKNLSSKERYHFKHLLIEMRNRQYLIKDFYKPTVQRSNCQRSCYYLPDSYYESNYRVFPCGTMRFENDVEFMKPFNNNIEFKSVDIEKEIDTLKKQGKRFFNFMDSSHVYNLIVCYGDLKIQAQNCESVVGNLLRTLDFYIDKANLSKQQRIIVEAKKRGLNNGEIKKFLENRVEIKHQENYISTIWNICCRKIAKAASIHYDEWCCKDYPPAWKQCLCCKEYKLKNKGNYMQKKTAWDGFSFRCKECESKKKKVIDYGKEIDELFDGI